MSASDLPPGWGGPSQHSDNGFYTPQEGIGRPMWIYAGFWWRVWAFIIDSVILSVVDGVLGFFMLPDLKVEWEETPFPTHPARPWMLWISPPSCSRKRLPSLFRIFMQATGICPACFWRCFRPCISFSLNRPPSAPHRANGYAVWKSPPPAADRFPLAGRRCVFW